MSDAIAQPMASAALSPPPGSALLRWLSLCWSPLSSTPASLFSSSACSFHSLHAAAAESLQDVQRRHPLLSALLVLALALAALAWLLPDVRADMASLVWGAKGKKKRTAQDAALGSSSVSSSSSSSESLLSPLRSPHSSSSSRSDVDVQTSPLEGSEEFSPLLEAKQKEPWRASPTSSSSTHRAAGPAGSEVTASAMHSRHRGGGGGGGGASSYDGAERERVEPSNGSRERERGERAERFGYERYERERGGGGGEGARRRSSRYDDDDDGAYAAAYGGGGQHRDRGEREKGGGGERAERRRRERDSRDGFPTPGYGDDVRQYRPSLSPTPGSFASAPPHPHLSHLPYSPHPAASLPSPQHRHHQSFSSVHSAAVPPSPSQASSLQSELRESSVSSLPTASMLSTTQSFSTLSDLRPLSSPSAGHGELHGRSASEAVVSLAPVSFWFTLARGCELVKYGKFGSPHVRWFQVQLVNGLARLSWGEPKGKTGGSLNLAKSIRMNDILDVKAGKTTAVFRQRGNDKLATDAQCCFSIITQKRSLDLQAKDCEERDAWVRGLRQIAQDSQMQLQQRQQQQAAPLAHASHAPFTSQPSLSSLSASHSQASQLLRSADFPEAQQLLVVAALAQQRGAMLSGQGGGGGGGAAPLEPSFSFSSSLSPHLPPASPSPFAAHPSGALHRSFFSYEQPR